MMVRCTIMANSAESTVPDDFGFGRGGGIYNAPSATLLVHSSIISNNSVELESFNPDGTVIASGGGVANLGVAVIQNSTIAHNSVAQMGPGKVLEGTGGGIYNYGYPSVYLTVTNSTISQNSAVDSNGGRGGGVYLTPAFDTDAPPFAELRNTIVAGNSAGVAPDLAGILTASGFNLIENSHGGSGYTLTDLLDVDPMLGPLADNGGPTLTMALLPDSPAIDAGDNTDAPEFDQRGSGFPRIVNGTIDIGALEVQSSPIPPPARPSLRPDILALILATADLDSLS